MSIDYAELIGMNAHVRKPVKAIKRIYTGDEVIIQIVDIPSGAPAVIIGYIECDDQTAAVLRYMDNGERCTANVGWNLVIM